MIYRHSLQFWLVSWLLLPGFWSAGAAEATAPAETPYIDTLRGETDHSWSRRVRGFLEQDYLLGTWGGLRSDLSKHGVDFEFFYIGALPSNVEGGIQEGTVYQGLFLMTLDLDSEKLVGYHGGRFHVGGLYLHGHDHFSDEHIGDFNKISLIDFPNMLQLWELWYEQKFVQDKLSIKAGQLAIDQDFIVPEYSKVFINQTFWYPTLAFNIYDIPGFPPGDHALASTPYGAPGVRVRVDPIPKIYFQAGVYDGNPDRENGGTHINLNDNEGALAYFEVGYKLNQEPEDQGLPGTYKLGAFYHTDDFYDAYEGAVGAILAGAGLPAPTPSTHSGNYGVYFLADQLVYRESSKDDPAGQGLGAFFRIATAPEDRNLTQFGVDGGLVYKGLIPGRDYDSVGIAASYLEISDDIADAFRDFGLPAPDYEGVIELTYKAQLTAWWTLQPSIERVLHPAGGTLGRIRDSWAVVLLSTVRF